MDTVLVRDEHFKHNETQINEIINNCALIDINTPQKPTITVLLSQFTPTQRIEWLEKLGQRRKWLFEQSKMKNGISSGKFVIVSTVKFSV